FSFAHLAPDRATARKAATLHRLPGLCFWGDITERRDGAMQALETRSCGANLSSETLEQLEARIERGMNTFVEVGLSLLEIRNRRLYREQGYDKFEDYCRERWGFASSRARQLIMAAEVAQSVTMVTLSDNLNERQARELAPLRHDPNALRRAWESANEATGGKPTAEAIRKAVRAIIDPAQQTEAPAHDAQPAPA